jgi:hypothetical protein
MKRRKEIGLLLKQLTLNFLAILTALFLVLLSDGLQMNHINNLTVNHANVILFDLGWFLSQESSFKFCLFNCQ